MGFAVITMRILEVLFFLGLLGCVVVVVLSWISVGRDSFSNNGH
jgi:hypothetical protein